MGDIPEVHFSHRRPILHSPPMGANVSLQEVSAEREPWRVSWKPHIPRWTGSISLSASRSLQGPVALIESFIRIPPREACQDLVCVYDYAILFFFM